MSWARAGSIDLDPVSPPRSQSERQRLAEDSTTVVSYNRQTQKWISRKSYSLSQLRSMVQLLLLHRKGFSNFITSRSEGHTWSLAFCLLWPMWPKLLCWTTQNPNNIINSLFNSRGYAVLENKIERQSVHVRQMADCRIKFYYGNNVWNLLSVHFSRKPLWMSEHT